MPVNPPDADNRSGPLLRLTVRVIAIVALIAGAIFAVRFLGKGNSESPTTENAIAPNMPGEIVFEDVTARAGIQFAHYDPASPSHFIHETLGSGVAWIDYDRDGWVDLLFIQDGPLPGSVEPSKPPTHAFYRNLGNGTFQDVTREVGLDQSGFGMGAAVGDYDNDGFDDLVITYLGRVVLYHNVPTENGSRRFVEVPSSGLVNPHFATSCAFGDIDGDGLLDLYVCNYVETDLKNYPVCIEPTLRVNHTCPPAAFPAVVHRLFRNTGKGTFEDITTTSGIGMATPAHGLGVAMIDLDGDGWLDILAANDMKPAYLFHNEGKGKFKERATLSGCGFGPDGTLMAGMGIAIGDVDDSGRPSVLVTNFQDAPNVLFLNRGNLLFTDSSYPSGLGSPSMRKLGFGTELLDADLDGNLDVAIVNGHVSRIAPEAYRAPYAQEAQIFRGDGKAKFTDVSATAGEYFQKKYVGRGLATGDYDNDGRPDLAIGNCGGPGILLRNQADASRHWLKLDLEGDPNQSGPTGRISPRSAIGAKVELVSAGRKQVRFVTGGGSYLSASDRRVMFGLGNRKEVERVTIHWPSGVVQELGPLEADRAYRVVEGQKPIVRKVVAPRVPVP